MSTLSFYLNFQSYQNKQFVYKQSDPLDDNIYMVFSGLFALSVQTPLENPAQIQQNDDQKMLLANIETNSKSTHQQNGVKRKELRVLSKHSILGLEEVVLKYQTSGEESPPDTARKYSVQCVEAGKMLVINEELFYQHYYNVSALCQQRALDYVDTQNEKNARHTQNYKQFLSTHNELLAYNK